MIKFKINKNKKKNQTMEVKRRIGEKEGGGGDKGREGEIPRQKERKSEKEENRKEREREEKKKGKRREERKGEK